MNNEERDLIFYHSKSGLLFQWSEDVSSYEPIMYNCKISEDKTELEGIDIVRGSVWRDYIEFVRESSMVTNKQNGSKEFGKMEIYQWDIAFKIIKAALALDSSDTMCAISRQAKNNWSV